MTTIGQLIEEICDLTLPERMPKLIENIKFEQITMIQEYRAQLLKKEQILFQILVNNKLRLKNKLVFHNREIGIGNISELKIGDRLLEIHQTPAIRYGFLEITEINTFSARGRTYIHVMCCNADYFKFMIQSEMLDLSPYKIILTERMDETIWHLNAGGPSISLGLYRIDKNIEDYWKELRDNNETLSNSIKWITESTLENICILD